MFGVHCTQKCPKERIPEHPGVEEQKIVTALQLELLLAAMTLASWPDICPSSSFSCRHVLCEMTFGFMMRRIHLTRTLKSSVAAADPEENSVLRVCISHIVSKTCQQVVKMSSKVVKVFHTFLFLLSCFRCSGEVSHIFFLFPRKVSFWKLAASSPYYCLWVLSAFISIWFSSSLHGFVIRGSAVGSPLKAPAVHPFYSMKIRWWWWAEVQWNSQKTEVSFGIPPLEVYV